jgi:hypothetical protein
LSVRFASKSPPIDRNTNSWLISTGSEPPKSTTPIEKSTFSTASTQSRICSDEKLLMYCRRQREVGHGLQAGEFIRQLVLRYRFDRQYELETRPINFGRY